MKQLLVNTRAGQAALSMRRTIQAIKTTLFTPERAGDEANDYIASTLLTGLCLPGRTFVDVGSHIGSVVSQVLRKCPDVSIEAIEADPTKAKSLAKKFPGVRVHACACAAETGTLSFYLDELRPGYSSLVRPENSTAIKEIVVPVARLDDLVAGRAVDVIKVDVEGAELRVLSGARAIVEVCRPTIMFESVGGSVDEWSEIWDWFNSRRYDILCPNRLAHTAGGMSFDTFAESHYYPRRCSNYFGVARERRDEIRHRARAIQGFA